MLRRARLVRTIAVVGSMAVFLALGAESANAAGETPKPIVGTGSDVAWRVMTTLDGLYNTSPGCNLLTATTQPLDQSCQSALPNQDIVTTEDYRHDYASELAPIGGTAGVNELCQEGLANVVSGIDFARQTSAPSTATCTGTNFVAYARDALDFQVFPKASGAGVASFNNPDPACSGKGICLTQAQLKGIFVNCTITNWNQVGGANVAIHPYVPLPQFGTRTAWDKFTRGDPIALLVVPSIGLSQVVIEGSSPSELDQGPGHVPATPLPGEFGNAVVLGRRVSSGAPFASLPSLKRGDEIQVTTGQGAFSYTVEQVRTLPASDPTITASVVASRLTLVTAGPLRSPGERTVVTARLEGDPGALATRPQAFVAAGDLGGGDLAGGALRVVLWSAVLALAVVGSMRLYRAWPARAAFVAAIPVLTLVTWQLFGALGRMLPGVV